MDDDRELQAMFDDIDEPVEPSDPPSEWDNDRKGRRRGRGRMGKHGRKGKKGRKGRKNKGPFDVEKWEEMVEKIDDKFEQRLEKIEERGLNKCEKLPEKMYKHFCEAWKGMGEESGYDDFKCKRHVEAKAEKCKVNIECKVGQKANAFNCNSDFKRMMMSFRKSEVDTKELTAESVGKCYTDALKFSQDCISRAETAFDDKMGDEEPIPEETITAIREAMKAAHMEKRESRRNNRRNKRGGRGRNNRRNKRRGRRDSSESDM